MNDTKMMSNPSSLKSKQIDSQQLNGNARKLFTLTAKDNSSSLVASSRSKTVNSSSKPAGNQCSRSVPPTNSIAGSTTHSNLNSNASVILCSSNASSSSHSTIVHSASKPSSSIGADSRKANRMASISHRTAAQHATSGSLTNRTANHSISSSNRTLNQTNNQSNNHSSATAGQPAIYPCQLCELHFDDIKRLSFHLVKIHNVDKRINLLQCYVDGCEEKFRRRMELVGHLNAVHNLGVVVLRRTVTSLEEFERWKGELEQSSGCTWIENNKFFLNNQLRMTYICDRPATNGSRLYSLHGLTTINKQSTFCLSSIKVIESGDGNFLIEFIETHNHDE